MSSSSKQIALVTGCSSGIGLATTARLARDPDQRFLVIATVIAMSEKADLEAAVGDALGKTVFIQQLDITDDDNIAKVVDDVIKTHGRIDILLNIAGMAVVGIPERVTRKQIELLFNVNTIGTMRLTQAVLPYMKKRRAGKIVTITSTAAKIGWPYFDFYCASKFALEGFFESLAAGLRAFSIRVCLVEPDGVNTGFIDEVSKQLDVHIKDEMTEDIDRRQLAAFLAAVQSSANSTADGVAEALVTRCLDVAEPPLRHLLSDEYRAVIGRAVSDLTGETAVQMSQASISSSP